MENTQKPQTSPKDFFLYFGSIVTLYISVISILTLLFEVINQLFPKPFEYIDPYAGGVSLAIAMLIVAFPAYLYFMRVVSCTEADLPEKRELSVRKWLLNLTLFVAGTAIAIDLIILLQKFFAGEEITLAFALKVVSIILVLATVFGYYLYDMRHTPSETVKMRGRFGYGSSAFVVIAIVVGFLVMGSPATQRMKHYDDQRVSDIQNINYQIINYWQLKRALPVMLTDVENKATGYALPVDPVTKVAYSYEVVKPLSYKLCATFSLANDVVPGTMRNAGAQPVPAPVSAVKMTGQENWSHGVGAQCFTRTIDPDLYPPFNTPVKGNPVIQ